MDRVKKSDPVLVLVRIPWDCKMCSMFEPDSPERLRQSPPVFRPQSCEMILLTIGRSALTAQHSVGIYVASALLSTSATCTYISLDSCMMHYVSCIQR